MTKNNSTINVRELAMEALIMVLEEKKTSSDVIRGILTKHQYLPKQDRAFFSRLSEGTIERVLELDYIADQFSKVKVKKMKPVIRTIIRMGIYQIKYMEQIPDRAACNESVKLAEKKGFYHLKGFVNGVLRNISRNLNQIEYPDKIKDRAEYFRVVYSVPQWLVELCLKIYPEDIVEKMFAGFLKECDTSIWIDLGKTNVDEYKNQLLKDKIQVSDGNYVKNALHISKYNYIEKVPGYEKGIFAVQDESSMLAVLCGGIMENMDILDVCAAPGGKALYAAWLLNGTGSIVACDISERKIERVKENARRLGIKNLEARVQDASVFDDSLSGTKDLVIADVPCSGLGVIGKKTDIKYHCTQEGILNLVEIQRNILTTAQRYVKDKGVFMFSTCTITQQENLDNVFWFLNHFDFELESLNPYLPESLKSEDTEKGYLQLIPGIHKADGFFIARFRKK